MLALRLALVYAASGALSAWIARRCVRRFSRRAALVLWLVPLALTGRAVATGGFYGALNLSATTAPLHARASAALRRDYRNGILSDTQIQMVPWKKAVREDVAHGHWPLWNPFILSGDVLLATAQPGALSPSTWIGFLLPLPQAWTFACTFTLFWAALFAFLYLLELGVSEIASLFGAAAWALSSGMVFWMGWPHAAAFAPLPLLLLGLRRVARGEPRGVAIAGVGGALSLLAGHPESSLHVAFSCAVVFAFDLAASRARLRALGGAAGAALLAAALAAPQLLPLAEALPQSSEFALRRAMAGRVPSAALRETLSSSRGAVYPNAFGRWPDAEPAGAPSFPSAGLAYVGGLALALAAVGALWKAREKWALLALAAASFAVAMDFPGVSGIVSRVPLLDISLNGRMTVATAFALSVLAALGLEELLARRTRGWAVGAAAAVMLAGGLLQLSGRRPYPPLFALLRASLLLLVVPPALFAVLARVRRLPAGALAAAAAALLLLSRLAEAPHLYRTFPARDFYPPVPEFSALPRGGEPYRVAGLSYDFVPNQSAMWGLEDPRGYEGMNNARLEKTLRLWSVPQPVWFNRLDDPSRPFLSFLNVRYLVAGPGAAVPAGWREFVRGPDCAIFENPRALPRAFAPARVRFVSDENEALAGISRASDYSSLAWIEEAGRAPGETDNGRARIAAREDGPDLRLDIRADSPAWIVASETNWKGWKVTVDGKRAETRFANVAFLAFRVPAGEHRVLLTYHPRSFDLGLALAALAAAGLAGAAWRARRRG